MPPVSTRPAANFATSFTRVVDTGGKFAAGVNDTGGKLPPVANKVINIRLQITESELEGKNVYMC